MSEHELLEELAACHNRGSSSLACTDPATARTLENKGLARWCGTWRGSSFYAITDEGLRWLQQ